jgi:hypothetical protein
LADSHLAKAANTRLDKNQLPPSKSTVDFSKFMKTKLLSLLVVTTFVVASSAFAASEPTALQLVKEGNRFVAEPSKGKVLAFESDRSILGLTPTVWTVSYFDADARSKVAEVKFGSGLKLDVKRPWRITGSAKEAEVIDLTKVKIDSDKALKIATTVQLLQPFSLKQAQLWLQRGDDGLAWRVRIWAAKPGKPEAVVNVGDVFISPADGSIIRADLHIERLN